MPAYIFAKKRLWPALAGLLFCLMLASPALAVNYAWNGGGVKNLMKFAEKIKWDLVHDPIEEKGSLKKDKFEQCIELANAMADKLLN
jgi:flavorubredoxin